MTPGWTLGHVIDGGGAEPYQEGGNPFLFVDGDGRTLAEVCDDCRRRGVEEGPR